MPARTLARWFGQACGLAWQGYNAHLQTRPITTKSLTGLFGMLISDVVAQAACPPQTPRPAKKGMAGTEAGFLQEYDYGRTARLCLWSFLFATPLTHYWFLLLESYVLPQSPNSVLSAALKVAIDQAFMTPFSLCLFFLTMKTLEGQPEMAIADMKAKIGKACLAAWAIWPFANLINFLFVPLDQRILFCNVIMIGYGAVLSHLQASKPKSKEKEKPEEMEFVPILPS